MSATEQYRPVWSWWDFKVCLQARDAMGFLTAAFTPKRFLNQSFSLFFLFLFNPQVHESDADDQDFGGYALAFAAGE